MIDVSLIQNLHIQNISEWHSNGGLNTIAEPLNAIQINNYWNFMLWHEEDMARIPDIEPLAMVAIKRNIDFYNQSRNNAMETIDEWVLSQVNNNLTDAPLHSETPGMMIDRLSILQLKYYHTVEETMRTNVPEEHLKKCANRRLILNEQIKDLSGCLQQVLEKLKTGALQFKVYRQLKMYNDPELNPRLYKKNS